jgi:hypothetical protein
LFVLLLVLLFLDNAQSFVHGPDSDFDFAFGFHEGGSCHLFVGSCALLFVLARVLEVVLDAVEETDARVDFVGFVVDVVGDVPHAFERGLEVY